MMNNKEITIQSYDKNAKGYSDWYSEKNIMVEDLDFFHSLIQKNATTNNKIIDLGCGPGHDSKYLLSKGLLVTGIDLSHNFLDCAQKDNPGAIFLELDFENELYKLKSKYSGVWACSSLLHVKKQLLSSVVQDISNLLDASGVFYISLMKGNGEELKTESRPFGEMTRFFSYYSNDELRDILLPNFKIIKSNEKGRWISTFAIKK